MLQSKLTNERLMERLYKGRNHITEIQFTVPLYGNGMKLKVPQAVGTQTSEKKNIDSGRRQEKKWNEDDLF